MQGTLFLDEIGELSPAVQVTLLRVLQEREFQRVGGTATLKADVRLIAASNRDLTAEIAAGRFRPDLFYRLGVFNVHLPPLRERGDDVLLLADAFIRTHAARMGKADVTLSRDALELLRRHPWPGNIRELQNAIERGLITCDGTLVTGRPRLGGRLPAPWTCMSSSERPSSTRSRARMVTRRAPPGCWASRGFSFTAGSSGTRSKCPPNELRSRASPAPDARDMAERHTSTVSRAGAHVHTRTPACDGARRCAQINSDDAHRASARLVTRPTIWQP